MSQTRPSRALWLPVLALLVAGGAAAFALLYEWDEPPLAVTEEARGHANALPAGGTFGPPPSDPAARPGNASEAEPEAEADEPIVMEAPEGVVAPEGEGIVGILVDATGIPVPRARISLRRNLADLVAGDRRDLARSIKLDLGSGGGIVMGRESGITDRQGRFAIREPGKDGTYDVTFTHDDHPSHTVEEVAWTAGSRVDIGVVRIPAGGVIFGFVRDEDGSPIAGARVSRTREGESVSATRVAFQAVSIAVGGSGGNVISFGGGGGELTDAEGYFEMTNVAPGTYTLRAVAEGKAEAIREKLLVTEGNRTGPISLVPSAGLEISGVVVDEHGRPVSGATVMSFRGGGGQSSTRTDEQGAFVLTALPPGEVRLTVFGGRGGMFGGGNSISETVAAGTSGVRLVMSQGLVLAGRMIDAASLNPINGARVSLLYKSGDTEQRRMTMGMNGAFRFTSLKPGDYTIEISASGYRTATEGPFTLVEGRSIEDILVRLQPE